ncbi:MAG: ATP-binding protein [Actinomycetota bacterium]|nr:ATP-binding protein [Actinomycetota bacterium]
MSALDYFDEVDDLPNDSARQRYDDLIGLDDIKSRLIKESRILIEPGLLDEWSTKHHGKIIAATHAFRERIPLFVFAGDVGTGKTELAETFGDAVAREAAIDILLFPMSLRARGTGTVGEMTTLISLAFEHVKGQIPIPREDRKPQIAGILLIDEADALAQSRELAQMHHEDRAGVNALIRGINGVAKEGRPIITVMCSNRLSALDPAIQRRAADIVRFDRPTREQRIALLSRSYAGAGFSGKEIEQLADLTGERVPDRDYPFTFSDLTIRLIPAAVIDAMPDQPLAFDRVAELAGDMPATTPFAEEEQ